MKRLAPRSPIHAPRSINHIRTSTTCVGCRQRHVRCSGGPLCSQCRKNGTPCTFPPTFRGQRRTFPLRNLPIDVQAVTCTGIAPNEQSDRTKSGTPCPPRATIRHESTDSATPSPGVSGLPQSSIAEEAEPSKHSVPASPPAPLTFISTSEPQARRAFDHFCNQTTTELCGHNDQAFWKIKILQVSHAQPGVERILMALGSLHESVEIAYSTWSTEEAIPLQNLSLRQCQEAIILIKQSSNFLGMETILVSCILLVCFETLQRNYVSAMKLLSSGLKVLRTWQQSSRRGINHVDREVIQAFCRVRMQASMFLQGAAAKPSQKPYRPSNAQTQWIVHSQNQTLVPNVAMPTSFDSLEEANDALDSIINAGYSVMDPITCVPDYPLNSKILSRLQGCCVKAWYTRLNEFHTRFQSDSMWSRQAILYLHIIYYIAYTMTPQTAPQDPNDEMRFDRYQREFSSIISLTTELLDLMDTEDAGPDDSAAPHDEPKVSRSFQLGVIPSLFLCAIRCRCPSMRRKAVHLLSRRNWQERSWNSLTAARIARQVIAIEEGRLTNPQNFEDVPATSRIKLLKVKHMAPEPYPIEKRDESGRDIDGMWDLPLPASSDESSRLAESKEEQPDQSSRRILLRYVWQPWDLTSPMGQIFLDASA